MSIRSAVAADEKSRPRCVQDACLSYLWCEFNLGNSVFPTSLEAEELMTSQSVSAFRLSVFVVEDGVYERFSIFLLQTGTVEVSPSKEVTLHEQTRRKCLSNVVTRDMASRRRALGHACVAGHSYGM